MPLKDRVDDGFFVVARANKAIDRLIRPIHAEAGREWKEPILKGVGLVVMDYSIAHARPGEVVHPGRVGREELGGPRREPVGKALVVFLGWIDLPAHVDKHQEGSGDLFRQVGDVGEFGDDVSH